MGDYDYQSLLKKAEGTFSKSDKRESRLKVPNPEVIYEGKTTILRNFGEMVEVINRDERHITKYLMKELGIGVSVRNDQLVINRKVSDSLIADKVRQYMDTFVICYVCSAPDTEIRRVGRTDVMFCKACGAQNPIRGSRENRVEEVTVEEGKTYQVTVTEVGKSGEGKANLHGVSIIVPGGHKGQEVRVLIKRLRNGVAIGEIQRSK